MKKYLTKLLFTILMFSIKFVTRKKKEFAEPICLVPSFVYQIILIFHCTNNGFCTIQENKRTICNFLLFNCVPVDKKNFVFDLICRNNPVVMAFSSGKLTDRVTVLRETSQCL